MQYKDYKYATVDVTIHFEWIVRIWTQNGFSKVVTDS